MSSTIVVVPCYNESRRLLSDRFLAFARQHPEIDFLFVDDGSTDDTGDCLVSLHESLPRRFLVHQLPVNQGKAEAVRQGILCAYQQRPDFVAYWDADLATPLDMIPHFRDLLLERPTLTMVMGSRVCLLGRQIERKYLRHLLGRTFATVASLVLGFAVYDTQCGAKMFRATPSIRSLFTSRFRSRWIFDVEILARIVELTVRRQLDVPQRVVAEFPLQAWRDVAGSKVRPRHFIQAFAELMAIFWSHRRNRGLLAGCDRRSALDSHVIPETPPANDRQAA